MRLVEIQHRADRHDPRWIDRFVALIVVTLDVREIRRLSDARPLIELACICPQMRVVDQPANVAFEVSNIHRIEANQRREEAPIRFRYLVARQVSASRQTLLELVQGS